MARDRIEIACAGPGGARSLRARLEGFRSRLAAMERPDEPPPGGASRTPGELVDEAG